MANLIGQILLKQFRVDSFIASGGMGTVYRVWDQKRNVPLAMKVLHGELAEDPSIFKRFQREANALKKLAHPHIVPFYGLYQTLDFAFMLERFIDGPSLKEVIKQKNKAPFTIDETLTYMKALSAALGYAHTNGVVHCDVKPGNVMIDWGGNIYLTDFGVARHADSSTTTLGGAGTPAYMPPEQIIGDSVTATADIYSLGVMLFEMLTGRRPFRGQEGGTEKSGSTMHERIRYAHLHSPPPDPRTINSSLSESLSATILKSLSKNPSERYVSTFDFFSEVCKAVGLTPDEISDRVVTSKPRFEFPSSSPSIEASKIASPKTPSDSQKIKYFHLWPLIGVAVLLPILCIFIIGMQVFSIPASEPFHSPPTETYVLASTPLHLFTPSPPPTLSPNPIAISSDSINLVEKIYSWISEGDVISVAFSPDGEYLASGNKSGSIKIWRLWEEDVQFEMPGEYVAFSPDGKWLGVADKKGIYLYDFESGELVQIFDDKNPYFSVAFSPDGQLIAGGTTYGVFFVWRISDGKVQKKGGELGGNVHSLSFSKSGILLAAASNTGAYVWNLHRDRIERNLGMSRNRPDYFSAVLDDDGEWYATGHNNGRIYIWRVNDAKQMAVFYDNSRFVNKLQFFHGSNDPEVLVSAGEYNLSFWIMQGYKIQGHSIRVSTPILSLSISPDNKFIATGGKDGIIHLWGIIP